MNKDVSWWEKTVKGGKALPESVEFWVLFNNSGQDAIPRLSDGQPKDRELMELNYKFAEQFQAGELKEAAKLLRHMKKRAEEIITQLEAEAIGFLKKLGYKFD